MQAERARLRAQRAAGAQPVEHPGARDFGHQLVSERLQTGDARRRGHARVVGEGDVDTLARELGRQGADEPRGRVHDHADGLLARAHV
jgi:hypothetical protein